MITQEIIAYIKNLKAQGVSREVIEKNLLSGGWSMADIAEGFNATNSPSPIPQPTIPASVLYQPGVSSTQNQVVSPEPKHHKLLFWIIGLIVLVLGGGVVFAYVQKVGPFQQINLYNEQNLFSGLLTKANNIDTSAYLFSGSLVVGPRDEGAKPFVIKISDPSENTLNQYKNDAMRSDDVRGILNFLRYDSGGAYPATLQKTKSAYSYENFYTTDPATLKPYEYVVTENGKNFSLKITFETANAISEIRRSYGFKEESTIIKDKTVTFTKDSDLYFYLPSTPPEPLLASLGNMAKYLPGEFKVDASVSAKTDWRVDMLADWTFNIDANGDFGDLQYKFNIDALKKEDTYYFKINNMPSIFLGMFSDAKGVWVKVNPKDKNNQTNSYSPLSSIADEFSKNEESYKKDRAEFIDLLGKAAKFADEEKLISFKNKIRKESIDGRDLYRYDLDINKKSVLPFYQKFIAEAQKTASQKYFLEDEGLVEYLQGQEFDDIFNYYKDNITVTLWADGDGFPAIVEYKFRVVPPDTAEQLKNKQVNIVFTLKISDINKPIIIEAPKDAKNIEDIGGGALQEARDKGTNALIKANLSNMRASAELYAYDHKQSYGKASMSGACDVVGTIFTDKLMAKAITDISAKLVEAKKPLMVCYSTSSAWAASASLMDTETEKGYWCVDSMGSSKLATNPLTSTVCK